MNNPAPAIPEVTPLDMVITREFAAPRERVWEAWTRPEQVAQWFGPHGFTVPECRIDLRVGGALRIVMRAECGTDFPLVGEFTAVQAPEKLAYIENCSEHPDEWHDQIDPNRDKSKGKPAYPIVVTVVFEALEANRTRVTVHNRFEAAEVLAMFKRTGMEQGWGELLEKLDALLARRQG